MKRCKHCGETKPIDEFYGDRKSGRDGRRPECKACNLAATQSKYAANPQPYIDRVKKWQQENAGRTERVPARVPAASGTQELADREGYLKRKYGITLDGLRADVRGAGRGVRDLR